MQPSDAMIEAIRQEVIDCREEDLSPTDTARQIFRTCQLTLAAKGGA